MSANLTTIKSIKYEKEIGKAINNSEMLVKDKHVRLVIIGTFLEKGALLFWRVALGFPYMDNKMVAWKLCYVLHKVLNEGHSLCCIHSHSHKPNLDKIGQAWYHLDEDLGKIITMYTKLLITKVEFHIHNPKFPGHLDVTLTEWNIIINNMTNNLQLLIDMLEYLDNLLQFQKAVFESMTITTSGVKTWECKLAPLALCVQESSQLYNHCVRILFILHSDLPTEQLQGQRIRFNEHFKQLKLFYSNINTMQSLNGSITVPHLPKRAPDFLIEANLSSSISLDGLGSDQNNLTHCIDRINKKPITEQVMFPKRNEFSEGSVIDLPNTPPLHHVDYQRSFPVLTRSDQQNLGYCIDRINKTPITEQVMFTKSNGFSEGSVTDLPNTPPLHHVDRQRSFPVLTRLTTSDHQNLAHCINRINKTPIAEQMMFPKQNGVSEKRIIDQTDHANQSLHRIDQTRLTAAPGSFPVFYQTTLESSGSNQNHLIDFTNHVDNTPVILPRNTFTEQVAVPKSNGFVEGNMIKLSDSSPRLRVDHWRPTEPHCTKMHKETTATQNNVVPLKKSESVQTYPINPFDTSFLDCGRQAIIERPPISPVVHQMHIENMIAQEVKQKTTSFDPFDTSGYTSLSPVSHQIQTEMRPTGGNSLNPFHTSFNDPSDNRNFNVPNLILPATPSMQMANVIPQGSKTTEENFSDSFISSDYNYRPSAPPPPTVTDPQINVEAIITRDNHIQYLQHELEILKHCNQRAESNHLQKLQEKNNLLEEALIAKENELAKEKQTKMLFNQVPSFSPQVHSGHKFFPAFDDRNSKICLDKFDASKPVIGGLKPQNWQERLPSCSTQLHSERNVFPAFEDRNSQMLLDKFEESNPVIASFKAQNSQVPTRNNLTGGNSPPMDDMSEWDEEDDIDEMQNGMQNVELDNKIKDVEEQLYLHMKQQYLEIWDNNKELFNIKAEILKINLENLVKEKQGFVADSEEKVKKENLVNRKIKKITSLLKMRRIQLK